MTVLKNKKKQIYKETTSTAYGYLLGHGLMLTDKGAINKTALNDYTWHTERGVLSPIIEVGKEL